MEYLKIPTQISSHEIRANGYSFSPGMYRRVEIPNSNTKSVGELLDDANPYDKGTEPGSWFYLPRSPFGFIRTKALQEHSTLLYPKGGSIVPLNPRGIKDWNQFDLQDGDLLMAKDSNVGECVMVDGDGWKDHAWSNGVVRLHPTGDRFYFFAFVKHPLFKAQLLSMLPRGATILHAKDLWLNCRIPFPNQSDAARVVAYVSALMRTIVEKDKAIRERHSSMIAAFDNELLQQDDVAFAYAFPSNKDIQSAGRMDAGFWSENLRRRIHLFKHYKHGSYTSIYEAGFVTRRGQNLQVSAVGVGYYFDEKVGNACLLASPADITDFMTIPRFRYYGNPRKLNFVEQGEVIFSAKGMREVSIGHSYVHIEGEKFLTNIDAFLIRSGNLTRDIVLGQFFSYCKKVGVFARLSDASNGGSFVQNYFAHLPIPKFPDDVQAQIARLYHNPDAAQPAWTPTLSTLVEWHRAWNEQLGIWELDREMKALQTTLRDVQEQIIRGETVNVPFAE